MEHLAPHWMDYYETWYLMIFRKSGEKIQIPLKSEKKNGYCTRRPMHMYDKYLLELFVKFKGKVSPKTGHDGPEVVRGMSLLFL
jgi:hypothetical protein